MQNELEFLSLLKQLLWRQIIGTQEVVPEKTYFQQISDAIFDKLGSRIHWHTIRNIYEGRHQPSTQTLNILATFLIGDKDNPKTFQHFMEDWGKNQQVTPPKSHPIVNPILNRARSTILKWISVGTLLLVILFFLSCPDKCGKTTVEFKDVFTNSNLEELREEGWFLFPDSIDLNLWTKDQNTGHLTLWTYLGDAWLENVDYDPKVINILAKKISCGSCCEIEVKLADFNPYQKYQQAGFFLFEERDPVPSLRYNFESNGESNHVGAVLRMSKRNNEPLIPAADHRFRRRVIISKITDERPGRNVDSLFLKLRIEGNQYSFYKTYNGMEYDAPIRTMDLPFGPPKYIGLAAFQGRPEIPAPIWPVADTIPANFGYVKIVKCKSK